MLFDASAVAALVSAMTSDADAASDHSDSQDSTVDQHSADSQTDTAQDANHLVDALQSLATPVTAATDDTTQNDSDIIPESGAQTQVEATHTLVVIDTSIDSWETLAQGISSDAELLLVDADDDGVAAVTEALAGRTDIDSIHIVSHGESGRVFLGSTSLDAATVDARGTEISSWSTSLSSDADILIWSCGVGSGEAGAQLLGSLASYTGADVAASDDATGDADQDGDWDLEVHVGDVDTTSPLSAVAMQDFHGLLNDAPVLDTTADALDYSEGDGAVALDSALTLTDDDNISSATVTITSGYESGGDVLHFTNTAHITGAWDAGTGTLTLTGEASVAEYLDALHSVTFENAGDNPSTTTRTVTFSVTDVNHDASSANTVTATRDIHFSAVNDAPTVAQTIADVTVDEDAANQSIDLSHIFTDVDNDDAAIVTVVSGNSNSSLVDAVITGNTLNLDFLENQYGTSTITVRGTSGGQSVETTFTVTVNAVDDAPTVASTISNVTATEDAGNQSIDLSGVFTDLDNDDAAIVKTVSDNTNSGLVDASISGNTLTLDFQDNQYGTATITVRGTSGGQSVETTFTVTVSAENDAPVITGDTTLTSVSEDVTSAANTGTSVADLLQAMIAAGTYSDADSGASTGIALTGADNANGTWEYSINGGTTWQEVGTHSEANALLLAATADNLLRFVPDANYSGTASLSFHGWDQTTGTSGSSANLTTSGGTTAFSASAATGTLTVQSVNDSPVFLDTPTLDAIEEDPTTNGGVLVSDFLAGHAQDSADSNTDLGIAITGVDASTIGGTWQYQLAGSSDWVDFPTDLAAGQALLLAHDTRIRFAPDANENGVATISFRAWDESSGSTLDRVDASSGGSGSMLSSDVRTASQAVSPVNDDPGMVYNHLGMVENHSSVQYQTISATDLKYADSSDDMEQSADQLVYELSADLPDHGRIELKIGNKWVELSTGSLFSQADVNSGSVRYAYTGGELASGAVGSDGFGFTLRDGAGATVTGSMSIAIAEANAPLSYTDSGISVDEYIDPGDVNVLNISVGDADPDATVTLTLLTLPQYGTLEFYNGSSWVAATTGLTFTKADLAAGSLRYVHDGTEPTGAAASTSFTVDMADGRGSTLSSQTVTLNIQARNDDPTLANAGLSVDEGETGKVITTADLNASDVDSARSQLTYTITSDTSHGWLELDGVRLGVGATFQQIDIDNGKLTYNSDGEEYTSDSFSFDLRDGDGALITGTAANVLNITVNPVNDAPEITIRENDFYLHTESTKTLTTGYITGLDAESDAATMTWTWTDTANIVVKVDGTEVTEFTQADLAAGKVTITHTGAAGDVRTVDIVFTLHDNETVVSPTELTAAGTIRLHLYEVGGPGINNYPPELDTNETLVVLEDNTGGTVRNVISNEFLSVYDRASDIDGATTYTLTDVSGLNGTLYLNGVALGLNGTFTQADIDGNLLTYAHNGSETTSASFKFTVSDGADSNGDLDPSADIAETTFHITVTPVNDAPVLETTANVAVTEHDDAATVYDDGQDLTNVENATALTIDSIGGALANLNWSDADNSDTTQMVFQLSDLPDGGYLKYWNGTSWETMTVDSHFSVQDVVDGKVAYFHNPDSEPNAATDNFTLALTDGGTTPSASVKVQVDVTPSNDAPTVTGGRTSIDEGGSVVFNASGTQLSMSDPDNTNAELTLTVANLPDYGTLWLDADGNGTLDSGEALSAGSTFTKADLDAGKLHYTHDSSENFKDTFTFTATDPGGLTSAPATVTIDIRPQNDDPTILVNTGGTVNEGETLTISTETVDDNAADGSNLKMYDPDNTATQVQMRVTDNVDHGYLFLDLDGDKVLDAEEKVLGVDSVFTLDDLANDRLVYQHDGSEPLGGSATDAFSFTVSDSGGGNEPTGTFNITITATNDAPEITAPASAILDEDSSVLVKGISIADVDAAQSTPGNVQLELSVTNGILNVSAGAGVTITANDSGSVTLEGTVSAINAVLTSGVRYTPDAEYNDLRDAGNGDVIQLTLSDLGNTGVGGAQTDTASVDITIRPVNDAPELTYDPSGTNTNLGGGSVAVSATEDNTLALDPIVVSDLDIAANELSGGAEDGTVRVTVTASHGSLTLADTTGLTGDTDGSDGTLTITGTLTNVNAALAALQYKGNTDYNGTDSIQVTVNDLANEGAGGAKSTSGTFNVTVNAANDAPVLDNSTSPVITVAEDATTNNGSTVSDLFGSLITDVDTGALQGIAVTGLTNTNGTWQYNTGSGWTNIPTDAAETKALLLSADAKLRFVPDANYNGTDTGGITFRAWDTTQGTEGTTVDISAGGTGGITAFSDATETLTATVTAVNDAPVITDMDAAHVAYTEGTGLGVAGTPVVLDADATISDYDLDNGEDNYDGATITVQRQGTAQTKDLYDVSTDGTISKSGSDLVIGGVTVGSITTQAGGVLKITFNANTTGDAVDAVLQNITFASTADDLSGTITVQTTFNDGNAAVNVAAQGSGGALTATGTVTIDVTPTNDAPIVNSATGDTLTAINEDCGTAGSTPTSVADIVGGTSATDPDSVPVAGIVITSVDDTNGTWQYSTDGGTNWSDVDTTGSGPLHLSTAATNLIRFVPDANFNGTSTFAYSAWDTTGAAANGEHAVMGATGEGTPYSAATATATITVNAVNDAPVITNGAASVDVTGAVENSAITVGSVGSPALSLYDLDLDAAITQDTGTSPTLRVTLENNHGTITLTTTTDLSFVDSTANGQSRIVIEGSRDALNAALASFTYTPGNDTNTTETIAVTLDDQGNVGGGHLTDTTDIVLNGIEAVNDAPVITAPATATVNEDGTLNFGTQIQISDVDARTGEVVVDLQVPDGSGSLSLSGIAGLTFTLGDGTADGHMTFSGTLSAVNAALKNMTYTPPADANANPTLLNGTVPLTITINDQGWGEANVQDGANALSDTETVNITVTPVNDAPAINGLQGDTAIYDESAGAVFVGGATGITDMEFGQGEITDFNGGSLTVSISGGGLAGDVLSVASHGDITVSGNQIRYQGNLIGTFTAGSNSSSLVISLTTVDATPSAVTALVNAVTYNHTTSNPDNFGANLTRTLSFVLNDGDGTANGGVANSATVTTTVTIGDLINDAPTLTGVNDLTVNENIVNADTGGPVLLDADVTFGDVDSANLNGGTLTLHYTSGNGAEDQLSVRNQGTGAGQIGLSGTSVTYAGTTIGTLSGGTNGADLSITLNANATPETVDALLQNLTYQNTSHNPTATRSLEITVSDGNGPDAATSTAAPVTITVNSQNDAPILDNTRDLTLSAIDEDTTAPTGNTVAALLASAGGDIVTDYDTGAVEGIAIYAVDNTHGTWQYNTGSGWTDIGTVNTGNALLLSSAASVRFVPDADFDGTATIQFHAWDQTSGSEGAKVDVTTTGTPSAFSTATETASITINAVNDAPVPTGDATLAAIDEDTTNPAGDTVANLFGGLFTDPSDASSLAGTDALAGIAVTGNTADAATQGSWEYSTDNGAHWTAVGSVSDGSALVLSTTAKLRFVPAADYNGAPPALTAHLVDDSAGAVVSGSTADVSTTGGTTAYSAASVALETTVNAVNDAPVISGLNGGSTYTENGTAVVIDADASILDVDIHRGEDNYNGATLTITRQGGADAHDVFASTGNLGALTQGGNLVLNGVTIGSVTTNSSGTLTLTFNAAASATQVNEVLQSVTYAYDGETPPTSVSLDVTFNDDNAASAQGSGGALVDTETAVVNITQINDTPSLGTPANQNMARGVPLVFSAANGNALTIADVDAGSGDMTTTLSVGEGTLTLSGTAGLTSVSGDGTGTVTLTGSLDEINAALEGLTYRDNDSEGTVSLTVQVNDNGHTGDDPGLTGTASDERASATLNIEIMDAVNDPPVITMPDEQTATQGTALVLDGANLIQVADPDIFAGDMEVTVSVTNGTLTLGSTTGLTFPTGDTGTDQASITFRGDISAVRAALDGLSFTSDADYTGDAVLTVTANDLGNTGSGGALNDSETLNITVNARPSTDPPHVPDETPAPSTPSRPTNTYTPPTTTSEISGGESGGNDVLPPSPFATGSNGLNSFGSGLFGSGDTLLGEHNENQFRLELENQTFRSDKPTVFSIPASAIRSSDPTQEIRLLASMPDGSPLPSWITFNPEDGTFSINPPDGLPHTVEVLVQARDSAGNEAKSTFVIELTGAGENNGQGEDAAQPEQGPSDQNDPGQQGSDPNGPDQSSPGENDPGQGPGADAGHPGHPMAEAGEYNHLHEIQQADTDVPQGKPGLAEQMAYAGHSGLLRQADHLARLFHIG
ncbi:MAG: cadherin-like domain-containing protein [Desulfovibrio sp.]